MLHKTQASPQSMDLTVICKNCWQRFNFAWLWLHCQDTDGDCPGSPPAGAPYGWTFLPEKPARNPNIEVDDRSCA